ncbi:MAG: universal stress protein [Gemmatimonadota bacterium]
MTNIDRILFPTDFSESSHQALPYAVALAETHDAELHLLHASVLHASDPANPSHHFPEMENLTTELEERADERMKELTSEHAPDGLTVVREQRRGISAPPVILEYVDEEEIDLVVMGTHGRRGLRHLMLGSVTEEVVRQAPCPVLTVRELETPGAVEGFETVLAPVDFSEHSELALRHAVGLAQDFGADLQLLHVVEEITYPDFYYPAPVTGEQMAAEIRERVKGRLEEAVARIGEAGVSASVHVVEGRPAPGIAEFAEENGADLVVVGTHGLTGIKRALLGSVAEGVVRRSRPPVLTVKSSGRSLVGDELELGLARKPATESSE